MYIFYTFYLQKSNIMKFYFMIAIYWFTLATATLSEDIDLSFYNQEKPANYIKELLKRRCKNDIHVSLEFSNNTVITKIGQDFINNPSIACLDLTNNPVRRIDKGPFNKLPNLIEPSLSNNMLSVNDIF